MTPARIAAFCHELKVPTIAREAEPLAEEARRQVQDPLVFLERVLEAEIDERRRKKTLRRLHEAGFPLVKTLAGFDFGRNPSLPESKIRQLAEGRYIDAAETVLFIGDPGTGKTHLATSLGVAGAEQGRSVRFVTAGRLVNELVEARDAMALGRVVARYSRVELLIIDELGYLPLRKTDAELLFHVLSERTEKRPIVLTSNLPFSEWTGVFPDPRLCRAVIDRLTHRAHVIDTGRRSIRHQEALARGSAAPEATP